MLLFDQPEAIRKAGITDVHFVFRDSRKLMWIGTENGLYRFDGTNIIYLRHQPGDIGSIPNSSIITIAEDRSGHIWLGTKGGIARMDPYSFRCKVYRAEQQQLSSNFDNRLMIDSAGTIWSGNPLGLDRYNEKTDRFEPVWHNMIRNNTGSGYVISLADWSRDSLAAGSFSGLVVIHKKNFGSRRIAFIKGNLTITQLHMDACHHLWIGTWGEGCYVSDAHLQHFHSMKWDAGTHADNDNIVFGISDMDAGDGRNIWIAAANRLIRIPLQASSDAPALDRKEVYTFGQDTRGPAISGALFADQDNYIWACGHTISRFTAGSRLFRQLPGKFPGLVANMQLIHSGGSPQIAISSWYTDRGLVIIGLHAEHPLSIDLRGQTAQLLKNISGVAQDRYHRLWVAALDGLYILDSNLRLLWVVSGKEAPEGGRTNAIAILNDTVWVGCYKHGIDLYGLDGHKLHHFERNTDGLKDDLFENFYIDHQRRMWLCGNGYFYRYRAATRNFTCYDLSADHTFYSPCGVAEISDTEMIIGSDIGLIRFSPASGSFTIIPMPATQKESTMNAVCADVHGGIWYCTDAHLGHYDLRTKKFTLFGEEDGLHASGLQCVRSFDGEKIWLADGGRIVEIDPDGWQRKSDTPALVFHDIQVNDSSLRPYGPPSALHLNYDQNKLFIEFDVISYIKPEQNQYAFRLDGLDKDWTYTDRNFASYANLPPGHYTFRVRAANYTGAWSREYRFEITIRPPFWRTWWFIGLGILLLGAAFALIVRYIAQRNLRERILRLEKEQAVEKERNRIARDMHDDLGSGLTKIAILSEVAKTQLHSGQAAVQLEQISFSSRELVDNLQDIIWVLNPRNDSLENLAAYIREYALKFFESTEVAVHFLYPRQLPQLKLSEELRRNIFLVIKETLNNTAKHAGCGEITIGLEATAQQVRIIIADDGCGFDPQGVRHFANGLANMKNRMEQVGGHYALHAAPGEGTETILTIFT